MPRSCLLTGQPGTGKSTLADALASQFPSRYSIVRFGELLARAVMAASGTAVTEVDLRERPSELVTGEILAEAHETLLEKVPTVGAQWAVVDSHAVSQDWYGFRSTPDGESYFRRLRYDVIVQLYVDSATLISRINASREGRWGQTVDDLARLFALQSAVSTVYASRCECPLYFVRSDVPVDTLVRTVDHLLTR